MYHISKDKRSRKSAELIWKGMEQCLQEKSFDKLRISDINQKSYVSRATFYRLFDSLQDVLAYECDQIYSQLAEAVKHADSFSKQDFFVLLVEKWMAQDVLIKVLVENNMTNVIYDTHMKNRDFMKRIFFKRYYCFRLGVRLSDCIACQYHSRRHGRMVSAWKDRISVGGLSGCAPKHGYHQRTAFLCYIISAAIPDSTAEITAIPTVPISHFWHLSLRVIYGLNSSVPGIVHAFV